MVRLPSLFGLLLCLISPAALPGQDPEIRAPLAELLAAAQRDSNDPIPHYRLALGYLRAGQLDLAWQALHTAMNVDPAYAPAFATAVRLPARRQQAVPRVRAGMAAAGAQTLPVNRGSLMWNSPQLHWYLSMGLAPPPSVSHRPDGVRVGVRPVRVGEGWVVPLPAAVWDDELIARRAFLLDPLLELVPPAVTDLPMYWRGTLQAGLHAYHVGRWEDASARFGSIIARSTERGPRATPAVALWYHALAAARIGRWEVAIADVQRLQAECVWLPGNGAEPPPRSEALDYALAHLYERAGMLDSASRSYARVLAADPLLAAAHAGAARILARQGDAAGAVEEYHRAVVRDPGAPDLVLMLGQTLAAAGEFDAAAEELERAIAANPRETRAYYLLGIAEQQRGRTEAARTALTRFRELAPGRYVDLTGDANRRLAALP